MTTALSTPSASLWKCSVTTRLGAGGAAGAVGAGAERRPDLAEPDEQVAQGRPRRIDLEVGVGGHAAQLAGLGERVVEPADRVDQAELLGLRAGPHAALRDRIDVGRLLAAAL